MGSESLISSVQIDKVMSFFLTLRAGDYDLCQRAQILFADDASIVYWGSYDIEDLSIGTQMVLLYDDHNKASKQEDSDTWFSVSLSSFCEMLMRIREASPGQTIPKDILISVRRINRSSDSNYSTVKSAWLDFKTSNLDFAIHCSVCRWSYYNTTGLWSGCVETHEPDNIRTLLNLIRTHYALPHKITSAMKTRMKSCRMGIRFGKDASFLENQISLCPGNGTAMWSDGHIAHYVHPEHVSDPNKIMNVCIQIDECTYKDLLETQEEDTDLMVAVSDISSLVLMNVPSRDTHGYTVWTLGKFCDETSGYINMLPNTMSQADTQGWMFLDKKQVKSIREWLKAYQKFFKSIQELHALFTAREGKFPEASVSFSVDENDSAVAIVEVAPRWVPEFEDDSVKAQFESLRMEVPAPKSGMKSSIGFYDAKYLRDMMESFKGTMSMVHTAEVEPILCTKDSSQVFILCGMQ